MSRQRPSDELDSGHSDIATTVTATWNALETPALDIMAWEMGEPHFKDPTSTTFAGHCEQFDHGAAPLSLTADHQFRPRPLRAELEHRSCRSFNASIGIVAIYAA